MSAVYQKNENVVVSVRVIRKVPGYVFECETEPTPMKLWKKKKENSNHPSVTTIWNTNKIDDREGKYISVFFFFLNKCWFDLIFCILYANKYKALDETMQVFVNFSTFILIHRKRLKRTVELKFSSCWKIHAIPTFWHSECVYVFELIICDFFEACENNKRGRKLKIKTTYRVHILLTTGLKFRVLFVWFEKRITIAFFLLSIFEKSNQNHFKCEDYGKTTTNFIAVCSFCLLKLNFQQFSVVCNAFNACRGLLRSTLFICV